MRIYAINIHIFTVILFTLYDGTAGKMHCIKTRETNHIQ